MTPEDRVPTHIWVDAHLRRCSVEGIPAVVIKSGEKMGGTVLLKIYQSGVGCRLLSQIRDLNGHLNWLSTHSEDIIEEEKADDLIRKSIKRDPDLWVVEIETRDGAIPVDGL